MYEFMDKKIARYTEDYINTLPKDEAEAVNLLLITYRLDREEMRPLKNIGTKLLRKFNLEEIEQDVIDEWLFMHREKVKEAYKRSSLLLDKITQEKKDYNLLVMLALSYSGERKIERAYDILKELTTENLEEPELWEFYLWVIWEKYKYGDNFKKHKDEIVRTVNTLIEIHPDKDYCLNLKKRVLEIIEKHETIELGDLTDQRIKSAKEFIRKGETQKAKELIRKSISKLEAEIKLAERTTWTRYGWDYDSYYKNLDRSLVPSYKKLLTKRGRLLNRIV